jgi:hypothetical protein
MTTDAATPTSSTSNEWRETPPATEEADLRFAVELLTSLQTKAAAGGAKKRALHAKALGAARGTLEIAEVPAALKHGILAKPRAFPALVRFSSAASRVRSDGEADVRGIAVQLEGVEGPRALGGAATTQDLLAIDRFSVPFRSVREFVVMQRVAFAPLSGLFFAAGQLGIGRLFSLLRELTKPAPAPASLAHHAFHSALPIRLGPNAMQYDFVPLDTSSEKRGKGRDALGDELRARLAREPVRYALEVRLFTNERETPIEDASVPWNVPAVRVGTLTLPTQDVGAVLAVAESTSFDPWHALEVHRPLGPMMRARKATYFPSVQARQAPALTPGR